MPRQVANELSVLQGQKFSSFKGLAQAVADSDNLSDPLVYLDTKLGLLSDVGKIPDTLLPIDFANRWVSLKSDIFQMTDVSRLRLFNEGFDYQYVVNTGILKARILLCDTEMYDCWSLAMEHVYVEEALQVACAMRFVHRIDKLSSRLDVCRRLLRNGGLCFSGVPDQAWELIEGSLYSPTKSYYLSHHSAKGRYHILLIPYWLKEEYPLMYVGDWWYLDNTETVELSKVKKSSRRERRNTLEDTSKLPPVSYPPRAPSNFTRPYIDFATYE